MADFDFSTMLNEAASRMRSGLASKLVPHRGERGTDREAILRQFLADHLPKRFSVDTGFVIDHAGSCSKQLDIVIVDDHVCTRFEAAGGTRFFPVESVVAVGQVKSSATSCDEWKEAFDNIESVKYLDRSGAGRAVDLLRQESIDNVSNHLHQVFSFVFVCGKALDAATARDFLIRYLHGKSPHLWPNISLVLDQYLMTFCCDFGICPNPMDARGVTLQKEISPGQTLLRFFLKLAQAVTVTRTSDISFSSYLSQLEPWSADVIYAATSDPPPYLHQVLDP